MKGTRGPFSKIDGGRLNCFVYLRIREKHLNLATLPE